jgi:hypothetical protein
LAKFQSSRAITRPKIIRPEWNVKMHFFFTMLGDIDLIFGKWVYNDELQIKFTFRSGPMIYGLWTLKFDQIFSCHHLSSLCLEILTWFLVYECIMMSYRSSLHFILVQWFLDELWPLNFEIWPNIFIIHSYTQNQVNISKHSEKKWWQLNIWPNFKVQGP